MTGRTPRLLLCRADSSLVSCGCCLFPCLQEASEVFLVSLFEDANLCARHAGYAAYKK